MLLVLISFCYHVPTAASPGWKAKRMSELELPTTRYARSGDISVAYQTMGHGSIDLIVVLGVVSHLEFMHEIPGWTNFLRRLAAFAVL